MQFVSIWQKHVPAVLEWDLTEEWLLSCFRFLPRLSSPPLPQAPVTSFRQNLYCFLQISQKWIFQRSLERKVPRQNFWICAWEFRIWDGHRSRCAFVLLNTFVGRLFHSTRQTHSLCSNSLLQRDCFDVYGRPHNIASHLGWRTKWGKKYFVVPCFCSKTFFGVGVRYESLEMCLIKTVGHLPDKGNS